MNLDWPIDSIMFRGRKTYRTSVVKVSFRARDKNIWAPRVESKFCLEGGCGACVV